MARIRLLFLALGIVGGLLFGSAFMLAVFKPGFVEQVAKDLIRHQVEKTVGEKVESIDAVFLSGRAVSFAGGYAAEIAQAKRQLAERLPERVADVVAEMANLDCECRNKIEQSVRDGFEWRITSAAQAQARLTTLIRTRYMETAGQLNREFRIFTASNALVFALLAVAAQVKRRAGLHLLPPALVLIAAAALTAWLYLFNQDWLHTIVFGDYVGFAYVAYLALVFAFLSDVLFNRARVTCELLNQLFSAVGSGLEVVPC